MIVCHNYTTSQTWFSFNATINNTWAGFGSVSLKLLVKSENFVSLCHLLCRTDGRMRYCQLIQLEKLQIITLNYVGRLNILTVSFMNRMYQKLNIANRRKLLAVRVLRKFWTAKFSDSCQWCSAFTKVLKDTLVSQFMYFKKAEVRSKHHKCTGYLYSIEARCKLKSSLSNQSIFDSCDNMMKNNQTKEYLYKYWNGRQHFMWPCLRRTKWQIF